MEMAIKYMKRYLTSFVIRKCKSEEGRFKERVQEGEYDGNIIYSCIKMEK
jgi:prenyltransferase beta subunit